MKTIVFAVAAVAGLTFGATMFRSVSTPGIISVSPMPVQASLSPPAMREVMDGAPVTKVIPAHLSGPIVEVAAAHDLDPALLAAVAYTESGFDGRRCSSAGACGLMQFMAGTAGDLGLRDRHDDRASLDAAARYLDRLRHRFGNDGLALAAYNWGPNAVSAWLKKGAKADRMPKETRDYVLKITGRSVKVWAGKVRTVRDLMGALALDDATAKMARDLAEGM